MRRTLTIVLAALIPSVLALGIWLGGHPQYLPDPIANAVLGKDGPRVVNEGIDIVHDRFYRRIDDSQLSNAALDGLVKNLKDRFSNYFSPQDYSSFEQSVENRFSGIGVAIRGVSNGLRVETVFEGSPAAREDLRVGDVIIAADGKKLAGLPEKAAVALVKGPKGSKVRLAILRGTRRLKKTIMRDEIRVPIVASRLKQAGAKKVAYIALSTFSSQDADDQMTAAIRKAKTHGIKGIVFDLRGNGGGLITEAQLIASMFLKDGPIVTTKGRSVPKRTLYALGQPIAGTLPVVVLVDGGTASASEIVTGALQDRKRATVVGTNTFGKGVFQEVIPLANGGALDITVGQYFLPSGRNLGGNPIKPDVPARDDPATPKRDEALDKALRVLARKL
ncbi:MAG: carboxyl-terminal processing protease [Solirubrobacteraceae bacterium]|jgi:carboxyl-terminal processing protease|nr:carboxyl-terminal processing protease [Solirubrobacteraceae bacterium]